jgi:hypothetical protein
LFKFNFLFEFEILFKFTRSKTETENNNSKNRNRKREYVGRGRPPCAALSGIQELISHRRPELAGVATSFHAATVVLLQMRRRPHPLLRSASFPCTA